MAVNLPPLEQQAKIPLEKKPSVDPSQIRTYEDIFRLQNAVRTLILAADRSLQQLAGEIIEDAPADGTQYVRKDNAWASISTGTALAVPSVIQSASYVGNGPPTFTLPAAPTPGNILLIVGTRYDETGVVLSGTWQYLYNLFGASFDGLKALYRTAIAGDTANITNVWSGGGNRGATLVLLELSADADLLNSQRFTYTEASRSSISTAYVPQIGAALVIGMYATTGNNSLATTPAGTSVVNTVQGVSTSASPRGLKVVKAVTRGRDGAVTLTASWPGSLTTYGMLLAIGSTLNNPTVTP